MAEELVQDLRRLLPDHPRAHGGNLADDLIRARDADPRPAAGQLVDHQDRVDADPEDTWRSSPLALTRMCSPGTTSETSIARSALSLKGPALALYQRAADVGDKTALLQAIQILHRVGRSEEATQLRRYGIEPGGKPSSHWEAQYVRSQGC